MNKVTYYIRYFVELVYNVQLIIKPQYRRKRRIYLLLSPQYLNYGDQGIALAELDYLRSCFSDDEIIDLNYSAFCLWSYRFFSKILPDDIIIITGGGYIGDIWPENHALVEKIIMLFPKNKLIFAPQTIFFSDDNRSEKRFADLLKGHGNFVFFVRDKFSCIRLSTMGFQEGSDFFYFPDFFLFYKRSFWLLSRAVCPKICFRDDKEATTDTSLVRERLNDIFDGKVKTITMAIDHVEIPTWMRPYFLNYKLRQFAKARILITDRLHAMLFAAYTGTPCIALDNISKKISGVYEWISSLQFIKIAHSYSEIEGLMKDLEPFIGFKQKNINSFLALQRKYEQEFLPILTKTIESSLV